MGFSLFINFDGNCKKAVEFYSKAFGSELEKPMTYADAPPDPSYEVSEADHDRIMYAQLNICGTMVMFCDMPSGAPLITGNNICPTVDFEDKAKVESVFGALSEGGNVEMELQKTFFSEYYGMVTDKYGVTWHVMIGM